MASTVIIFNPTARGDKAKSLAPLLDSIAGEVELRPTRGPGDAVVLAREAMEAGFTTIVAAGGDGTVNEVLNGMASDGERLGRARLAVLPLGTVNVFAKELGIPTQLDRAWQLIRRGQERRIDLPMATYQIGSASRERYFVQLAGAGLDSRAIAHVRWSEKKRLGQLAYVLAGLRALREQLPRLELELPDGRSDSGELILIGNGRFYGGRWPLFPKAEMADGLMDIMVVPRVRVVGAARILWALQFGTLDERAGVRHYQVESCSIRSDRSCEFELEGDNVGMVPLRITMKPGALRVVVPA